MTDSGRKLSESSTVASLFDRRILQNLCSNSQPTCAKTLLASLLERAAEAADESRSECLNYDGAPTEEWFFCALE